MKHILYFLRDFVIMFAIIMIVEFAFVQIGLIESLNLSYIAGFMIGWSIWQIVKNIIAIKRAKRN